MSSFIIGKQYIYKDNFKTIYTAEYENSYGVLFSWVTKDEKQETKGCFMAYDPSIFDYKEYTPPVVHKRYVHFFKRYDGEVFGTVFSTPSYNHKDKNGPLSKHLGSIPVEFTEKEL